MPETAGELGNDGRFEKYQKATETGTEETVDCGDAIKVYIDVRPHELKKVDDEAEQFRLVFVLKLWWLDPNLTGFLSELLIRKPGRDVPSCWYLQEVQVIVRRLDPDGKLVYQDPTTGETSVRTRNQYVSLQPPTWTSHFFPKYSIRTMPLMMRQQAPKSKSRNSSGATPKVALCAIQQSMTPYSMKA